MAEREQKQRRTPSEAPSEAAPVKAANAQGEKIKSELDDLLDEIDEVLETNAEEFVESYVQKGGE